MPTWNKKRSGGGPFHMKSYGQGKNPITKLDVFVDGENIGTGPDAVKKGKKVESKKNWAWKQGDPASSKEQKSKKHQDIIKTRQTRVKYTGDDARNRIHNDPNMSTKEKREWQAKIDAGESFTG